MADEVVRVGRVGKRHGLDGSFVVEDASDDPQRFAVGATLWIDGEAAQVVSSKRAGGRPVIRLDRGVERGEELTVPRDELPPPADEDTYYVADLVGAEVVEDGGRVLGRVRDVLEYPAHDVLELETGLALPMVEDCVLSIDLEARRIVVAPGYADPD